MRSRSFFSYEKHSKLPIIHFTEDTLFTRNNVLDGKYSTNKMISSLETASIVDCVRQCSRNSQCVSIFFKTQTNLCLQNSMFYNHASLTEQGVVYYDRGKLLTLY